MIARSIYACLHPISSYRPELAVRLTCFALNVMAFVQSLLGMLLSFLLFLPGSQAWRDPEYLQPDLGHFGQHHRRDAAAPQHEERAAPQCSDPSCFKFYNDQTAPYLIKEWPLVPNYVDTGEFYSGSIPVDESDPSRTLFFIFKPAINASINPEEVVIWLNGGPGCSSLVGFFQENGPILWQPGTFRPDRNPWTWAKITNSE